MTLTGLVRLLRHPKGGNPAACGELDVVITTSRENDTLKEEFVLDSVEAVKDNIIITIEHKKYTRCL